MLLKRSSDDNLYFEGILGQSYPAELQMDNANCFDTEAPFWDFELSITNGINSFKMYDKRKIFLVLKNLISNFWIKLFLVALLMAYLSYDVASGSEITPCNKIDKPLVVYRFTGNFMTSIYRCAHNDKILTFLRQKWDFKVFLTSYDK